MAAWNAERTLSLAIQSILEQTYTDWELVIVDDGSSDATWNVIQAFSDSRIRAFQQPHQGVGPARNRALQETRGPWIAVCDADDQCFPHRFKTQLDYLQQNPEVVLLGGQIVEIDEEGTVLSRCKQFPLREKKIRGKFLSQTTLCHGTSVYPRELALSMGGYPEALTIGEDVDLLSKIAARGRIANLPQHVLYRRIHRHSICTRHTSAGHRSSNPDATYFCRVARALLRDGEWKTSREAYWKSVSLSPLQLEAYYGIMRSYLHLGSCPNNANFIAHPPSAF